MKILLDCVGVAGACWLGYAAFFGAAHLFVTIGGMIRRKIEKSVRFWL